MQPFSLFCILFCVGFCLWSPASPKTLVAWVPVAGEASAIRMERSRAHVFRESPGCFGKYPGFCLKSFPCWDPDALERPYGSAPLLCIQTYTQTHSYSHVHPCTHYHTLKMHTLSHTHNAHAVTHDAHTWTLTRIHYHTHTHYYTHMHCHTCSHTHTQSQVHTITSSHKQAQSLQNSRNSPAPHPGVLSNSCPTSQTQENHF